MHTIRGGRRALSAVAMLATCALWPVPQVEAQPADLVAQGRQALDAKRIDEAIGLFERAASADAKNPAALAWLGSAQVRKAGGVPPMEAAGWVKRGFDTLDEAVERFPATFVVYLVRGITATNVPDMFHKAPVAVKDLSAVVTMREANAQSVPEAVMPTVYLHLGLAYKRNRRPAEARAAWEKGRTLYPSAPEAQAIERELRSL
jgi:tetratricopeptide (TPR) repeat protein